MKSITESATALLEVRDLRVHFPKRRGLFSRQAGSTKAVDGVSFFIQTGETLGLVGESGCGKTTTGRSIIRLIEPTTGEIWFRQSSSEIVSITRMDPRTLRAFRKNIQLIFQDPYSSLNPQMTVHDIIAEPLRVNRIGNAAAHRARVNELLQQVHLSSDCVERYPSEFSGGQRQRIGIARALALRPRFIICDEPVSALDVSVQAQVINLLKELQRQYNLTYLFISHDLSVVYNISDQVAVMYLGKIVELASNRKLYAGPKHPYTEALMLSIPSLDPDAKTGYIPISGEVPDPSNPPSGCYFHTRCKYKKDICSKVEPELVSRDGDEGHLVACHRATELKLDGAPDQKLSHLARQPETPPAADNGKV
jgi:peptide/nickel transport system ATP-binding protein